jgi:aryl-alcohol dehydrogenase-like predicted oxidoreductase
VQSFESPYDEAVINAVQQVAEARDVTMAQVALAWVLRNPLVSAPIVGATELHHLEQAVDALNLHLSDEEATTLEKPYVNAGPSWF